MKNDNDGGRKTFICLQWYDRSITKHIINFTRTVLEHTLDRPNQAKAPVDEDFTLLSPLNKNSSNVTDQWTQVLRVPKWAVAPDSLMCPASNNAQTTQRLCSFSAQTMHGSSSFHLQSTKTKTLRQVTSSPQHSLTKGKQQRAYRQNDSNGMGNF